MTWYEVSYSMTHYWICLCNFLKQCGFYEALNQNFQVSWDYWGPLVKLICHMCQLSKRYLPALLVIWTKPVGGKLTKTNWLFKPPSPDNHIFLQKQQKAIIIWKFFGSRICWSLHTKWHTKWLGNQ